MTRIINDQPENELNELEVAFSGDRDLGDYELRRIQHNTDQKIRRLGDSIYPEGFITQGLEGTVQLVTNVLTRSDNFTHADWTKANGATVAANVAADRAGEQKMSRLNMAASGDPYLEYVVSADPATGRIVFHLDAKLETTPLLKLSFWDGVEETSVTSFTLTSEITRYTIANDDAWTEDTDTLTVRVRGTLGGTVILGRAQVEEIEAGQPLVGHTYVPTAGAPASAEGNVVSFAAGAAFAGALPRLVAAQTLTYDPLKLTGSDTVYLELAQLYIDAEEHRPDLDHPITGFPGNDSVRESTQLVTTDTTNPTVPVDPVAENPQYRSKLAVPVYQFNRDTNTLTPVVLRNNLDISKMNGLLNGRRIETQTVPEDALDTIATEGQYGLLAAQARRMFNATGNYVNFRNKGERPIVQDTTDTEAVTLKINPLDGYASGRSYYLEEPIFKTLSLEATTEARVNEGHSYLTATVPRTYTLSKFPVTDIDSLSGIVEVVDADVVKSALLNPLDPIYTGGEERPIYQIIEVKQTVGETTTVFVAGTDYVQNGDFVDWTPASGTAEPEAGSTYKVTYRYTRTFGADEYSFNATSVTFLGDGTDLAPLPVNNTPFQVDYHYGLSRRDLIYLSNRGTASGGSIGVVTGIPHYAPVAPAEPAGTMPLWEVLVPYDSTAIKLTDRYTPGVSMAEMVKMQKLLYSALYDIATLAAHVNYKTKNTGLKEVQTDPFMNADLFDTNAAWFGEPGELAARIDLDTGTLRMARTRAEAVLNLDTSRSTCATRGAWAGLPFEDVAKASQLQYSSHESVNPFSSVVLPVIPPMITLSVSAFRTTNSGPRDLQRWFTWAADRTTRTEVFIPEGQVIFENDDEGFNRSRRNGRDVLSLRFTTRGTRFLPGELVTIRVDGVSVGTTNADASGNFEFTVTREAVSLSGIVTATGEVSGVARATFNIPFRTQRVDPQAQTFVFDVNGDCTGVDLFFFSKGTTEPCIVTMRPLTVGLPSEEVLAMRVLMPSEVKTDGTATRINWPEPVPVVGGESYVVVAASNDDAYRVWMAQLGKANLGPGGGIITKNPYAPGSRIASGDGVTWTPYQDSDLRFNAYQAKYEPTATAYFDASDFSGSGGVTGFQLHVFQRIEEGAALTWQYSTDEEATWTPFDPAEEVNLPIVADTLIVRAIMTSDPANRYAGVGINHESVVLETFKNATKSSYVTLEKTLEETTTSCKGYVRCNKPVNTTVTPYMSNDGGETWIAGALVTSRGITPTVTEYEYTFTFGGGDDKLRARLDLETTTAVRVPWVDEWSAVVL
jgi:hypothetical protein